MTITQGPLAGKTATIIEYGMGSVVVEVDGERFYMSLSCFE